MFSRIYKWLLEIFLSKKLNNRNKNDRMSKESIDMVITYYELGFNVKDICLSCNVSKSTVYRYIKLYKEGKIDV